MNNITKRLLDYIWPYPIGTTLVDNGSSFRRTITGWHMSNKKIIVQYYNIDLDVENDEFWDSVYLYWKRE